MIVRTGRLPPLQLMASRIRLSIANLSKLKEWQVVSPKMIALESQEEPLTNRSFDCQSPHRFSE
jgi:hypothetical protein